MLQRLRAKGKRVPVIGRLLYRGYRRLRLRFRERDVDVIRGGPLEGLKMRRFRRTVLPQYLEGDHEPALQRAIVGALRPGGVFFDVGGHGGFFALLGARAVGASGVVVTFEPHPENARELRMQLALNGMTNVRVVGSAVCDRRGMARIGDDCTPTMHSLAGPPAGSARPITIRVPTTTLDDAIDAWGVPDVVKIDIEGAEASALRGATRLLRAGASVLFVEIHNEPVWRECYRRVTDYKYGAYRLGGEPIDEAADHEYRLGHKPIVMFRRRGSQ